ncbi:MAG: LCP family protein [Ardenticatenales bacterium]|nr:LCP family protein [Ardenticatenales bacterium]
MATTRPLPTIPAPAARPRSSWLLRILFTLVVLFLGAELVTLGAMVAFAGLSWRDSAVPVAPPDATPAAVVPEADAAAAAAAGPGVWDRHGPVNILLLGMDRDICEGADPESTANRTDTMIVVRIDPRTAKVTMMNLPRDLWVFVPGHGSQKLTTAHYWGEAEGYEPDGGPGLAKQVIWDNFEIPVHRYVRVDFDGFLKIVDAVGPITVDVPPSPGDPTVGLHDDMYPTADCQHMTIDFPPGPNDLDGERALQYARSRYSTSDLDRSKRQMQVLIAIKKAGMRPGVILDLPKLIPALQDTVDTDLTPREISSLARIALRIGDGDIYRMPIDERVVYLDSVPSGDNMTSIVRLMPAEWNLVRSAFLAMEPDPLVTPTPTPTDVVPPTVPPEP